jgi:chondroitin AC lyase
MKKRLVIPFALLVTAFMSGEKESQFIDHNFSLANTQLKTMLTLADRQDSLFPKTIDKCELLKATSKYDWTSGFFAGNLWYQYQATGDDQIKQEAIKWTEKLESLKYFTEHHDLGFMLYCSYGNAYRLTGNEKYKDILVQGAKSLCKRFNPTTGSIKSWNVFNSWDGKTKYSYPVIIDNMVNLELLFFASTVTGDPYYKNVAIQHANHVLKNQLRADYSCYHVVCYDSLTGKVVGRETAQGYADNSTWSRGQAWGIYGFTVAYRETKDAAYLTAAKKMADYFLNNKELPADKVPYWDFNANDSGYHPGPKSYANEVTVKFRDASAAAVTASALLELSTYLQQDGQKYKNAATYMLHSLSSPAYLSKAGENCGFLLKHSVGSIAHDAEIDVPLIYADYYFLEALNRYKLLLENRNVITGRKI